MRFQSIAKLAQSPLVTVRVLNGLEALSDDGFRGLSVGADDVETGCEALG